MNDLYPLTFIALATIGFLTFTTMMHEKEEKEKPPIPPRPPAPPPYNPRKEVTKLTDEIKCPTCGSKKISRMDAYTEVDEIDAITGRTIRRSTSTQLISYYHKCRTCEWTSESVYF